MGELSELLTEALPEMAAVFYTEHEYGGLPIDGNVDTDQTQPRPGEAWQGLTERLRTFFVPEASISRPVIGTTTTLDGDTVIVRDCRTEAGQYVITLELINAPATTDTCTVIHYAPEDGINAPTETTREADLPCRVTLGEEEIETRPGRMARATARVSFTAGSGLVSLAATDRVLHAGTVYRVLKVQDDRDGAGGLIQRLAWLQARP